MNITGGGGNYSGGANLTITNASTADGSSSRVNITSGPLGCSLFVFPTATSVAPVSGGPTGGQALLRILGAQPLVFATNNLYRGQIPSTGGLVIAAPTSGNTLTLSTVSTNTGIILNMASSAAIAIRVIDPGANNTELRMETTNNSCFIQAIGTSTGLVFQSSGGALWEIGPAGGLYTSASAGGEQISGSLNASALYINGPGSTITGSGQVFAGVPQNAQAGNYTLALTDNGRHILCSGAAAIITIPANASVAFPVGTLITGINNSAGNQSLQITTDTIRWSVPFVTGNRTVAAGSVWNILKVSAQIWVLTGVGIT